MSETNRKIFASSGAAFILATFISWLVFAPATPEPTVQYVDTGVVKGYIVNIDGEEWSTSEEEIDACTIWINMRTGEDAHIGISPFGVDSIDLRNIINCWNEQRHIEDMRNDVKRIKGM